MKDTDTNLKLEIGKRIKELRIKQGMSQKDLAEAIGYTAENSRSTKIKSRKEKLM